MPLQLMLYTGDVHMLHTLVTTQFRVEVTVWKHTHQGQRQREAADVSIDGLVCCIVPSINDVLELHELVI